MPAERGHAVDAIIRTLAPYLGPNMARAATLGHCEKLGLSSTSLDDTQLEGLLSALTPGLAVFVGRSKTDQIIETLRQEIAR
jgi:hypothetical protein